jgi:hypothetical protein
MISRRSFLGTLGLAATVRAGPLALIDDPRFERGCVVWKPEAGKKVRAGVIRPAGAAGEPAWGLAQWYSRFNLADAKPEQLESGALRFFDGAKAVTFGAGDVILALDGRTEYRDHAPERGDPWPHLLVEQTLREKPFIPQLDAVSLKISYRLLKSETFKPPGWDERRHTAQFLFYLTVQNGNRQSPGFGDYLWFGVPMYDARYPIPHRYTALDKGSSKKRGTGKFIFNPGGEQYTTQSAHDRKWITIDRDLLPLIREALDSAWERGYLADSRDVADYRLGGMNMGWEVTGPLNAAMQVRGLSLEAVVGYDSSFGAFRGDFCMSY